MERTKRILIAERIENAVNFKLANKEAVLNSTYDEAIKNEYLQWRDKE